MNGGRVDSPISWSRNDETSISLLGCNSAGVRKALNSLKNSLVKFIRTKDKAVWTFKQPTIADAFAAIIAEDPELLDIYLEGTTAEKLIAEVVCGEHHEISIEGATVIIPEKRYDRLLHKLNEIGLHEDKTLRFLAFRCGHSFLEYFVKNCPTIFGYIANPHSYLYVCSEVDLVVKLGEFDLLPEIVRREFVASVEMLAVETPDAGFLDVSKVRGILKQEEIVHIKNTVRKDLIPYLGDIVQSWRDSFNPGDDPEDHFWHLKDALEAFEDEFGEDKEDLTRIGEALTEIEWAIEALLDEFVQVEGIDYTELAVSSTDTSNSERDIFDDIDE